MLTFTGIVYLIDFRYYFSGFIIFLLPYFLTLIWGLIALIGAFLLYINNENGDYLLIYSGCLAVFCSFFPFFTFDYGTQRFIIFLSYSFAFRIDPFLILLGGLIDLLVKKGIILK
ncbi:MAG: hypothetical protein EU541_05405 [Promethearchaeota archaeon]|nr:MAG: hypothetical protein EU541_05405 [Candidatus Lokiarchaeota archaeon]